MGDGPRADECDTEVLERRREAVCRKRVTLQEDALMQRRHFMAVAGAGIAGAVSNSALAQQESKSTSAADSAMQKCAAKCYDCAQECDACAAHCVEMVA